MQEFHERREHTEVAVFSSDYFLWHGLQAITQVHGWIRLTPHVSQRTRLTDIAPQSPQIAIIDSEMECDVRAFIQQIKTIIPRIRVILLTGHQSRSDTSPTHPFDERIDAIVLKTQPPEILVATIEYLAKPERGVSLTENRPVWSESPLHRQVTEPSKGCPIETRWPDGLTERECEVIRLVSEGLSNKEIGQRLLISSITVRHHLTNIFGKLGVATRQKLLIRVHQAGTVGLLPSA